MGMDEETTPPEVSETPEEQASHAVGCHHCSVDVYMANQAAAYEYAIRIAKRIEEETGRYLDNDEVMELAYMVSPLRPVRTPHDSD